MSGASVESLFTSGALRISDADAPFWYTSGEIGPYYINTHFLCGGEEAALGILDLIDREGEHPSTLPQRLLKALDEVLTASVEYRTVISTLAEKVRGELGVNQLAGISGGQRRDWFFAPLVARELGLPCVYLYNDGRAFHDDGQPVQKLAGGDYLNICDLLRVGSSYTSKWIPIIAESGGVLRYSLAVVDRAEGGKESLLVAGVEKSLSLFTIDESLFEQARAKGFISQEQFELVRSYLLDPRASMRSFLQANPQFLSRALESADAKIRQRAQSLVKENYYQLDQ